jgi:predicted type IV restriction endonuclease
MQAIPKRVNDRLIDGIKRFQPILAQSKARDDGEGDTVMIVTDMVAEVFGYDKFTELTAEYAIKGTYCDLATKIDGVVQALIEVKAIGSELKDQHVKQAVDYAANKGVDWVFLTNGIHWRIYNVIFGKPIEQELIIDLDFGLLNPKSSNDLEQLFLLCKEGWIKSVLDDFQMQRQALSKFFLGALVLSDLVLKVIRRELRRVSPDVKIEVEQIKEVLAAEVLKREVIDGDKAAEAQKKLLKAMKKAARQEAKLESSVQVPAVSVAATAASAPGAPPSPA